MKLWDKGYGLNKEVEKFTVGEDYMLDKSLLYFDCIASIAHAKMLHKIGILNEEEKNSLTEGLNEIIQLYKEGKFEIKQEDEDCHTSIENHLVNKYGDVGKKIHTGRSRNDQVMVALKLYMKHELSETKKLAEKFIDTFKKLEENKVPLPGYTHTRKAMPSSVALWAEGFKEAIQDDLILVDAALKFIDSNPFGSAAGYGVNLHLDKKMTTELLDFGKVQAITAVQISRGKNEAVVINALLSIMLDLGKMSSDLIMFSMPEFGFFNLPDEFTTGSSIMPQKKNPDVLEIIRAKSKAVQGNLNSVLSIITGLPSGYHRDFQLTKKPLAESIEITKTSLSIMDAVIQNLKINEENCRKAMTPELYAADEANELVKKGMPFREAYKAIGEKYI